MATKSHTIKMVKDKETKGSVRFAASDDDAVMTTAYVRKPAGDELGDKVSVTIKAE